MMSNVMVKPFLLAAIVVLNLAGTGRADYALRDGDRVVFLGDSITAARTYGKIIENYTLLRFPDRQVHFANAGWGGDTASGGLKRLERDVFAEKPTVLIVAYGINDIGWGTKADEAHRKLYLDSIRGIIEQCKARSVRVFICSAAITAEDPDTAEKGYLQQMCDDGLALAKELGEGTIDVQRSMRPIQRRVRDAAAQAEEAKDRPTLHAADGVHLNDLGQLTMAFAILKGLGAPAEVSAVSVDVNDPDRITAEGCRVTNLAARADGVEFDRLDQGLPINFGIFGALQFRFVPIPDELNRYMLSVKGLPTGRYEILAEGRPLGVWPSERIAEGVNLASATADGWEPGGPWDAEAGELIRLTDARSEIATARRFTDHHLPGLPQRDSLHSQTEEIDAKLEQLQRTLVHPRPFHFVVRPEPAKKP